MAEVFDTLTTSESLQKCGLSEEQSKGITRAINSAITENTVTKANFSEIKTDLKLWMFKALSTFAVVVVVVTKLLDYILDKLPL